MSRAISFFSYSTLACGAHDLQRPVEVGHARAGRVLPRFAEVVVLLPGDVAQHDDLVVLPHARGARSGRQCERDHGPESTPLARPRTTAAVIAREHGGRTSGAHPQASASARSSQATPAARGVKPRPRDVKDRAAALRGLLGLLRGLFGRVGGLFGLGARSRRAARPERGDVLLPAAFEPPEEKRAVLSHGVVVREEQREHPAAQLAGRDLGPPSACARRSVEAPVCFVSVSRGAGGKQRELHKEPTARAAGCSLHSPRRAFTVRAARTVNERDAQTCCGPVRSFLQAHAARTMARAMHIAGAHRGTFTLPGCDPGPRRRRCRLVDSSGA